MMGWIHACVCIAMVYTDYRRIVVDGTTVAIPMSKTILEASDYRLLNAPPHDINRVLLKQTLPTILGCEEVPSLSMRLSIESTLNYCRVIHKLV